MSPALASGFFITWEAPALYLSLPLMSPGLVLTLSGIVVQLLSHVQLLANPVDYSTPGFPVLHYLPELAPIHVRCLGDAIQLSHLLTPSSPSALKLSQHQGLFQ